MDKEKEIAAMTAEIQYAMDVVGEKNKTTIAAEALAWYLIERKDYHKADEVRKETAKEILQDLYDEAAKYDDETISLNTYEIKQWATKFGIEVDK